MLRIKHWVKIEKTLGTRQYNKLKPSVFDVWTLSSESWTLNVVNFVLTTITQLVDAYERLSRATLMILPGSWVIGTSVTMVSATWFCVATPWAAESDAVETKPRSRSKPRVQVMVFVWGSDGVLCRAAKRVIPKGLRRVYGWFVIVIETLTGRPKVDYLCLIKIVSGDALFLGGRG